MAVESSRELIVEDLAGSPIVPRELQVETHDRRLSRLEPRIDPLRIPKAPREESCRHEQHRRHRHLDRHEHPAEIEAPRPAGTPAGVVLERRHHVGA